jgi:DNA topoisomerase-1
MTNRTIDGDKTHKRLYELIWKRTIASQMADAELEKTNVTIGVSKADEKFIAKGEVIKFDGFLKVYMESSDEDEQAGEEGMLPPMNAGDNLDLSEMTAQEKFTQQPFRYTEAMLVKKLEELGIGRPSTYAPIISTIQKREYVVKEDRPGILREYTLVTLKKSAIKEEVKSETVGSEKSKLFPTDIGTLVNNFLVQHFNNILDYNFTASVEEEFDEIAEGRMVWNQMISEFYFPFHKQIEGTLENTGKVSGEKLLGKDPKTSENVFVKIGRYGPMAQIGDADAPEKPRFASLKKGQSIDTITLEEALELFRLPRKIGEFETSEVVVAIGRFGPYIRHKSLFYSLPKDVDPLTIELDRASEIIVAKRQADSQKILQEFTDDKTLIQVLNGRYGAYIACNKENYKIPKGKDPRTLTLDDCRKIIAETQPSKSKSKKKK